MFCVLQVCPSQGADGRLGRVQINTFHSPWMLDRHWKRGCLHWGAELPPLALSSPPVFQSPQRHDPFKWLFTCIRRRAKALLNEVLSTIQLEWTSQQHNFPLSTMLTSAEQKQGKVGRPTISCGHTCSGEVSQHACGFTSFVCLRYCPMWSLI